MFELEALERFVIVGTGLVLLAGALVFSVAVYATW